MNTKLIVAILLSIAGIILLAVAWFFIAGSKQPVSETNPSVTLPSSGLVPVASSTAASPTQSVVQVAVTSGTQLYAKDFIHNGVTIADAANKGRYLLAGNLQYCVHAEDCQVGPIVNYNIYFNTITGTFTIALLKEPIGTVRLEAEQFLLSDLGITRTDMCRLNYYLGTTSDINPAYSTKNLGFSFCPGAVALPQ